jgi:hypothetical protein
MTPTTEATVTTPAELFAFVKGAKRGQRCRYHNGSLQNDRCGDSMGPQMLHLLAKAALKLADNDLIHLLQRKEGEESFAYLAVRSRKSCQLSTVRELHVEN